MTIELLGEKWPKKCKVNTLNCWWLCSFKDRPSQSSCIGHYIFRFNRMLCRAFSESGLKKKKGGTFLKPRSLLRVQDCWGPEMRPLDWRSSLRFPSQSFSPLAKLSLSWQSERVHKGLKSKCLPAVMGSSPPGEWMCVVFVCIKYMYTSMQKGILYRWYVGHSDHKSAGCGTFL